MDIRDAVAKEVRERGFKQIVLAKNAGLTEQQLSDVLNKKRRLEANELLALCSAMRITPNDLTREATQ